jgi:hypothetical protein
MPDHYHHVSDVQGAVEDRHSHDVRDVSGAAEERHHHYASDLHDAPSDRELASLASRVAALEQTVSYLSSFIEGRTF